MGLEHILAPVMLVDPRAFSGRSLLLEAPAAQPTSEGYSLDGNVAVVNVDGPLRQRGSEYGYDGYEQVHKRLNAALSDPSADAVLLRINSPGGQAAGAFEGVREMRAAKKAAGKPVIAFADEHAYSGAYAVASAADKIYLPEAGGVGSVGVISVLEDWTKFNDKAGLNVKVITSGKRKADGHPDVPLTPEAIARDQEVVDHLAGIFAGIVGEARGMTKEQVLALEADTFEGSKAVDVGLADGIANYRQALSIASNEGRKARQKREQTAMYGQLAKKLGLADSATEAEVIARVEVVSQRLASADTFTQSIEQLTGRTGGAAIGVISAWKEAAAEVPALRSKLAEVETAGRKASVEAEVETAIREGRLAPASREYAIKLGTKDTEMFRGYMDEHKVPLVTVQGTHTGETRQPAHSAQVSALDEEERKICKQLGISEEDYIKTRDHRAKHGPTAGKGR